MVASSEGPISMCLHNAKRDHFILRPVPLAEGTRSWDPLTRRVSPASGARRGMAVFPLEYVKRVGRCGGSVP